jgi:hypothetical protein
MSTDVTMQELELETAELLPARETLNVCYSRHSSGNNFSFTQVTGSGNGNHSGNGSGNGILNIGNGTLNGSLDGNTVVLG